MCNNHRRKFIIAVILLSVIYFGVNAHTANNNPEVFNNLIEHGDQLREEDPEGAAYYYTLAYQLGEHPTVDAGNSRLYYLETEIRRLRDEDNIAVGWGMDIDDYVLGRVGPMYPELIESHNMHNIYPMLLTIANDSNSLIKSSPSVDSITVIDSDGNEVKPLGPDEIIDMADDINLKEPEALAERTLHDQYIYPGEDKDYMLLFQDPIEIENVIVSDLKHVKDQRDIEINIYFLGI